MVEAFTGILFAIIAWQFFMAPFVWLLLSLVAAVLVVVFAYDLRHTIIPNELVLLLTGLSFVFLGIRYLEGARIELLYTFAAALMASGIFATLWLVSRGRLIGLGDAKLIFPLALMLTQSGTLSFIVLAFWIGTAYVGITALVQKLAKILIHSHFSLPRYTMQSEVPFGPFLIVGFFAVLLANVDILILTQTFADATTRLVYNFLLH